MLEMSADCVCMLSDVSHRLRYGHQGHASKDEEAVETAHILLKGISDRCSGVWKLSG